MILPPKQGHWTGGLNTAARGSSDQCTPIPHPPIGGPPFDRAGPPADAYLPLTDHRAPPSRRRTRPRASRRFAADRARFNAYRGSLRQLTAPAPRRARLRSTLHRAGASPPTFRSLDWDATPGVLLALIARRASPRPAPRRLNMALDFGTSRASAGLPNERSPGVAAGASSLIATLRYTLHTGIEAMPALIGSKLSAFVFPVVHCRGGRAFCED
jgi:hypothetical protein